MLIIAGAWAGCSQTLPPVFPEPNPPMAWPPGEQSARIRYVGQLRSDADLHAPPKPFQGLSEILVGARPAENLYGPRAVVCSREGRWVWAADPGGRRLHGFDLDRRVYKKIAKVGPSSFLSPVGLCSGPGDSIYVCDSEGVAIYRLSATSGALLESLRLPPDVLRPAAVAFDAESGELFVVDVVAHDIKVLSTDGKLIRTLGRRGTQPGEFNFPCDIRVVEGALWVVDTGNNRVQNLTRAGEPVTVIGQAGDAPGDLALPKSVALDSDGHVYVVDARFENVQIFDASGQLLLSFGSEGTGPGEFWLPSGIFIDSSDRIWICDTYNRRLQVFDYVKKAVDKDAANAANPPESVGTGGETKGDCGE